MAKQRVLAIEVCPCGTGHARTNNGYELLLIANKQLISEMNVIVKNSDVCSGPVAQGSRKLFPRRLFRGLGGTMRDITWGQGEQ